MFKTVILTITLAFSSAIAHAEATTRVDTAFQDWLNKQGAKGAVALVRNGTLLSATSFGIDAQEPVELASLSKAITGVCAASLVARGDLTWDDTVAERLGQGPDVTLGELVAQTSGLTTDSTQRLMQKTLDTSDGHQSAQVLETVVKRTKPKGPRGAYHYNNENYALIGLMIEAASDRSYVDVCHELAIVPAGVSARASPRAGAFLPWGGWQMTVGDYALWHHFWFGNRHDPTTLPNVQVEGGVNYGLGTFYRQLERGNTAWHFGALCFGRKMKVGSYVVTLFGEWTIMAAYDECVSFRDMFALDNGVVGALFGGAK